MASLSTQIKLSFGNVRCLVPDNPEHGEPIRVKQGERVLLHILNGSATEIRSLALPGHSFQAVALDGNPVPNPTAVPVLWIGTAERVSAIVQRMRPST
jgi:FtsP/CotA-like multicopper oxidase with cupredoxin domain